MCHFLLEQKSKEVNSTKKIRAAGGGGASSRLVGVGLGASGDLLQVMDALLVNHADVEGGKVEDEAPVQLQGGARRGRKR